MTSPKEFLTQQKQHLLTGVSFAIPFIACGGILIALALAFAPAGANGAPDPSQVPWMKFCETIGGTAFTLVPVILGGYIANSIAGKPGLVAGMVGAWLSNHLGEITNISGNKVTVSAGFLGALVAGLLAGHLVAWIKTWAVPKAIKPIMPILIIPILSSAVIAFLMLKVVGIPISNFMAWLGTWLQQMGTGNQVVLAMILGAMIAFDMGGPVNKVAFFFGAAMIKEGNFVVMGACAAAICTPPIGMGLATILGKKQWSEEERESGAAALAMGMIGITEGAIPFAAADPLKVIPSIVLGSMVSATVAMLGGVGDHAPHGGPIVLPVVDNKIMFIVAILAGVTVTALTINAWKAYAEKKGQNPAA